VDASNLLYPLAVLVGMGAMALAHWMTESNSRWMMQYSREQLEAARALAKAVAADERMQEARDRRVMELTRVVEKLDISVARMYLDNRNRTVLTRDTQAGESDPNAPAGQMVTRPRHNSGDPAEEREGFVDAFPDPKDAVPT